MFCEVILSQRFPKHLGIFDYKVPDDVVSEIKIGQLVSIPFRSSEKEGIIIKIKKTSTINKKIKSIVKIIQDKPIITSEQIQLAEWMANYYSVSLGTIIKTMLPPVLKNKMQLKINEVESSGTPNKINLNYTKQILEKKVGKYYFTPENIQEKNALIYALTKKVKGQILIIVPTIKDIDNLVNAFPKSVQEKIAIIKSGLNKTQYHSAWQSILNNKKKIIIGTKLALFSPLIKPELLILDQEDSQNHKQAEQNPRYDSRQVIHKMSEIYKTKLLLLNPATTINSYFNISNNTISNIKEVGKNIHQSMDIVDMKNEQKIQNYSLFSERLQESINKTLSDKKQILLFINKRGGSSSVICKDCGENLNCSNCDQPLTYHTKDQFLYCHQCNQKHALPNLCPKCHGPNFKFIGTGTQKVEIETRKLFSKAKIARLDTDDNNIQNLNSQDIIIGTELALSHMNWDKIGLVGVISADTFLYLPDYSSTERTWHLLNKLLFLCNTEIIIQTYSTRNPAIKYLNQTNQELFYESELSDRESLNYPPYSKIIQLIYSNKDKSICLNETKGLYSKLKSNSLKIAIITPLRPFLNNKWQMYIIIKFNLETEENNILKLMTQIPENWTINRDPINLL
ncbi:MAG: replication restart helicase PriA [Candidatus Kerfeldbacteria bacterium]